MKPLKQTLVCCIYCITIILLKFWIDDEEDTIGIRESHKVPSHQVPESLIFDKNQKKSKGTSSPHGV